MTLGLVALIACGGGTLTVSGDTGAVTAADDTGLTGDTGGTTDTLDTVDTEDTTPPDPIADTSVWSSELTFNYDGWGTDYDCVDEVITETSAPPTEQELVLLSAECPACTAFYDTTPSTSQICGWLDLPTSELRGLVLGDTWAQVYRFSGNVDDGFTGEILDSAATFDGWTAAFSATLTIWWTDLDVDGVVSFPETSPEEPPETE